VGCPSTSSLLWTGPLGVIKTGGLGGVEPDQNLTVSWGATGWSDVIRGDLNALRTLKVFKGTVLGCVLNDGLSLSTTDGSVLTPGNGFYYLGRGATCNVNPYNWTDGSTSEKPNRNGSINSDKTVCP
jgi:hypothetical protein